MKRFIMKKAEQAGYASHSQYARSLTSREVSEQMALAAIDPPMEAKLDLLLSQLCYLFASANAKKGKQFKFNQFRPWIKAAPKSEAEQIERVKMWAASFGKAKGKA